MGKLNKLNGVANNLADSFVSVTNRNFLKSIELSFKKKAFEIDLLKEKISLKQINPEVFKKTIQHYKKWFLSEIKRLKIEEADIDKVLIKLSYKVGKKFARYYVCIAKIKAKGRNYIKKVLSSYC